jgi:hypothetical protein
MMGGQGWAGVIASVTQVIVQASASSSSSDAGSNKLAAIAYFAFAAATLAGCALAYVLLIRMPFAQTYMVAIHPAGGADATGAAKTASDDDGEEGGLEGGSPLLAGAGKKVSVWSVFKKTWTMSISLFLVFFMTFVCVRRLGGAPTSRAHSRV